MEKGDEPLNLDDIWPQITDELSLIHSSMFPLINYHASTVYSSCLVVNCYVLKLIYEFHFFFVFCTTIIRLALVVTKQP